MRVAVARAPGSRPTSAQQLGDPLAAVRPCRRRGCAAARRRSSPTGMRGFERRVRVLEDDLDVPAQRPQLPRPAASVSSPAVELDRARRSAGCRLQDRPGRWSTCRSPDSPTSPSVSPRRSVEADAVDRLDLADGPAHQAAAQHREVLAQVAHLDDGTTLARWRRRCRRRGSAPALGRRSAAATERRAASTRPARASGTPPRASRAWLGARRSGRLLDCRSGRADIGQRGANGQPGGRSISDGGAPGDRRERLARRRCRCAAASRAARSCTACAAGRRGRRRCPISTARPAYMTSTRSAMPATTPRSWVISTIAAPVSSWAVFSASSTWAWIGHVERGGRLVGDDHVRAGWPSRSRSPRAGACRRRTRAGTASIRRSGLGMPTQLEQLDRPLPAACSWTRLSWWAQTASASCVADRVDRVQRGHRVLEDHRDVAAPDRLQLLVAQPEQLPPAQPDRAGDPRPSAAAGP